MSAAGCQTGMPVLCHAHNGTSEHTTGTGFVLGCITIEAPVAMELCVLMYGTSRQAKWRHTGWTVVGHAGRDRTVKPRNGPIGPVTFKIGPAR